MKRFKNLYSQICTFENLLLASQKAQKGKRFQDNVAQFNFHLEKNILQLLDELKTQTYQPGKYKEFHILEPKPRMISAAPYRDRVVHHALCNIIEPLLERSMIHDSYANRKGKGTHKAISRYQSFCKKSKYVLKCDVRKFFPSIDHEILKAKIQQKIGCEKTLWLINTIINNSNTQEPHLAWFPDDDLLTPAERRKGLPIGNLTSQLFGNYYLNGLDHFIKEELHCKRYIRYVDDFVILENDKAHLHEIHQEIILYLEGFRLKLHKNKSRIYQVKEGVSFLGFRIFPDFKLVKTENIRRFRTRLKLMQKIFWNGNMTQKNFNMRVRSWFVHVAFANTFRLRKKIYCKLYNNKGNC